MCATGWIKPSLIAITALASRFSTKEQADKSRCCTWCKNSGGRRGNQGSLKNAREKESQYGFRYLNPISGDLGRKKTA
jgi:hypothetical protein